MDNFESKINKLKQNSPLLAVSEDFEHQVFAKIKKKKTQRKVTASAALFLVIFAFIFIARAVWWSQETGPAIMAGADPKEEVPVIEDVIFGSSDSRTTYAIEQVSYKEDDDTI